MRLGRFSPQPAEVFQDWTLSGEVEGRFLGARGGYSDYRWVIAQEPRSTGLNSCMTGLAVPIWVLEDGT